MAKLLSSGADVEAKNQSGATAPIGPANDPRKARLRIKKGSNENGGAKPGPTPLPAAAACDGCSAIVGRCSGL
ncbi:MAG: hypothetical protein ABI822_15245 [Bryobacteraceae bacterium]